ncbi:SDR family NAD(P)-dependent oxidoreductase (plasmid) [Rhizobium leguminosarum]|jgi:NAD(P)-dependent dehydrogenase (short-subunit alcohol dehydrogenase family)|uniref:3-oxoacyl-ACP reductase n=2 Tax=Rhizobium leguminosarum TaxID=384 RepID=A0A1B8R2K8_RHILT|nr:SDR family NAD(P)-dependent oxidoreductase [Rhizobium leguminosarum]MDH6661969.1 NAD(P)-dependent dehydrogenase (short-subunit alcohol dehydrogenase family) [Rhizobium sophorae]AOO94267.1 3-oxoacyl-ACP reductase [Rhizobium leguminosarum bv. trifolii]MBB4524850.1 NAD(P)-dependent dehydrogenase (short-subunit alcohol dehydrogenase family) [Rhizobium leguminosarum]MBP2490815.1 NAD(P)-dependent dehydrogenase (short-subunit alcohol dehydrogenase family) [Rhizobium leguminosarum]MBY5475680.1 SDR 
MSDISLTPSSNQRLVGRRIVITGAASGIGRVTASLFMEEGAKVILLDRNAGALETTFGGRDGVIAEVDITKEDQVTAAINQAAEKIGGIDGVINAAGIMMTGPTAEITPKIWRQVLDVNLSGSFFVIQACLPWLRRNEISTVVNIASGAGLLPNAPGLAAYAASKGGVIALTKALAADLAPAIRVNCVCPGMVDTPMADGFRTNVGNYALKRIADPAEIARAMLFLTSPDSSYVTGATLAVDGGRTFH